MTCKAAIGLGIGGGIIAWNDLAFKVHRERIFVAGLPREFDGFRVALISDFHHGPWLSQSHVGSVVDVANALRPDLIALGGDYIHRGAEWAPGCARELSRLRAEYGVFGVLGNHDLYKDAGPSVRAGLKSAGVEELTNRGVAVRRDGAELWLGGVGDFWREKQDLASALSGARGEKSAILLSHNPDYVEHIRDERVGLVLSGHTHGGQVVLPFIGSARARFTSSAYGAKYIYGLCNGPVAQVFVTRGIGTCWPPVRINCPPEIALLTLSNVLV